MSTTASASTGVGEIPRGPGAFAPPSLSRLTGVELRKMVDTRAGLWLQVVVAVLTVAAVVVLMIVGDAEDRRFHDVLAIAIQPATFLLPVIGILLVTTEWTQRTALITFALVPRRGRVIGAKVLAAVALGAIAFAVCLVVALIATAVGGADGAWDVSVVELGQALLYLLAGMITGVAFGAVARASAPAIVAYFALPAVFGGLGSISALHDTFGWLDTSRALEPMVDGTMSGVEWARAGTALLLWMVLPLAVGTWRLLRGEVRS